MGDAALTFDENGYLYPYDLVPIDRTTLIQQFGVNEYRRTLLTDYENFLAGLRNSLPINHRQWIDGSFASRHEKPGDIDVVVLVPHEQFIQFADELKKLKKEWKGSIDCYFVETFPPDHQKYEMGRADELDWYHFLRTDRRKRLKGILDLYVTYGN